MIEWLGDFKAYSKRGMALGIGFEPQQMGASAAEMQYQGWGWKTATGGKKHFLGYTDEFSNATGFGRVKALGAFGPISIAGSIYNAYLGYREEGLGGPLSGGGLVGAMAVDISAMSAVARFGYATEDMAKRRGGSAWTRVKRRAGVEVGAKTAGKKVISRFAGTRGIGAYLGATIGEEMFGVPGAFIGGYVGAAPIRFVATHPLLAAGAAATAAIGAAAGTALYGGYHILRAGYRHQQARRGVDTSGSMASFMTMNAQTMRSRAVQAIAKSHMNARSALGMEAQFMHMPSKNYHSRYR